MIVYIVVLSISNLLLVVSIELYMKVYQCRTIHFLFGLLSHNSVYSFEGNFQCIHNVY